MKRKISLLVCVILVIILLTLDATSYSDFANYAGTWKSTTPNPPFPKIIIDVVGNDAYVQAFTKSGDGLYDIGRVKANVYGGGAFTSPKDSTHTYLMAIFDKNGLRTILALDMEDLGWEGDESGEYRLVVREFTSFNDGSGRYGYWTNSALKKEKISSLQGYNPSSFRFLSYSQTSPSASDLLVVNPNAESLRPLDSNQMNPNPLMGELAEGTNPSIGELPSDVESNEAVGSLPGLQQAFNPSMGSLVQ